MNEYLQALIFRALTAHEPLMAQVIGVYDDVLQPPDTGADGRFPYVTIGEGVIHEWDTDDSLGAEGEIAIHVWSRQRGQRETKRIQGRIYDALHRLEPLGEEVSVVTIDWVSDENFRDADGVTYHGVSNFRALIGRR